MFNNERGLKVHMRFKHRESPHEIIPQLDGEVSLILSEGCCDVFTQTDEIESFPLPENNVDENLVSVPYYVDEFENMSDSESATLDLKITAVNADEGLKSIVSNFDRIGRFNHELSSYKDDVQDEDDDKFTSFIFFTEIDRCDIFRVNARKICEETIMYVY